MDQPSRPDPILHPGDVSGFEAAQLKLARLSVAGFGQLNDALMRLAEIASAALGVERVGIWLFVEEKSAVRCDILYLSSGGSISEGTLLHAKDFPEYFRALEQRRVVSVMDVEGDPLTGEFRDAYFRPLGITSMLDVPVYLSGKVAGIVCHEHTGSIRTWAPMDHEFVTGVAEVIGRLYEESARMKAESILGGMQSRIYSMERLSSLGRLAAGIAHDFRNVLGAAGGYAELIQSISPSNPELSNWIRALQSALDQGLALTRELTTFGMSEPAKPRVLDLRGLLKKSRGILDMAVGADVRLRIDAQARVARVFIDPVQVERILLNLVLNARDAMPDGGEIVIVLRESKGPETYHPGSVFSVIDVSDSGVGMAESVRSRIFEPFFTTKGDKGTGLGLSIVNQIVSQAGGFISVDSARGKGTRFSIHLPGIGHPESIPEVADPERNVADPERGDSVTKD